MERILVLGGSGFIGDPLVEALRAVGKEVSAPTRGEVDVEKDPRALAEALRDQEVLILLTSPSEKGIKNIASAVALLNLRHVLYASTGLVYASSDKPQREDAPVASVNEYTRQKLSEEEALRQTGVPLTIMRLGNVYGGPKNKGVVQRVLRALYSGEPLEVNNESQIRDFVHVEDVVRAILLLLECPPMAHQVVNVMTGKGTRVEDLIGALERLSGKTLKRVHVEGGELQHVIGDIHLLQTLTQFVPKITLEEGLQKTIEAYDRSIR